MGIGHFPTWGTGIGLFWVFWGYFGFKGTCQITKFPPSLVYSLHAINTMGYPRNQSGLFPSYHTYMGTQEASLAYSPYAILWGTQEASLAYFLHAIEQVINFLFERAPLFIYFVFVSIIKGELLSLASI